MKYEGISARAWLGYTSIVTLPKGPSGEPKNGTPEKRPKTFLSNIGFIGIKMIGMIPRVTKKN